MRKYYIVSRKDVDDLIEILLTYTEERNFINLIGTDLDIDELYNLKTPNDSIILTNNPIVMMSVDKDYEIYKVDRDNNGDLNIGDKIDDISYYTANIIVTSPLFNLDSCKIKGYNNDIMLSDYDYKQYQLNLKVDEMLELPDSIEIKKNILEQLKAL